MIFHLNRLAKVATVAAMTLGMTFVGQPVQKASAQVLIGAGSGDIITLTDLLTDGIDSRYVVTGNIPRISEFVEFVSGSSGQETGFISPDSDLDINNLPPELRRRVNIVNSFNTNIALTYNVPGFDGTLTGAQVCALIRGDITDWNQITGDIDSLPVIRVVSGGVSASSQILQHLLFGPGGGCHAGFGGSDISIIDLNSGVTVIPNQRDTDIIVQPPADPFTAALNSGDNNNSDSYSLGIVNTVANTPGAIGYVETVIANLVGLPLAVDADTGVSTLAVAPRYFIFRQTYPTQEQAVAAFNFCLAVTDTNNLAAAGFSEAGIGADSVSGGNVDACGSIQGPQ